MTGVEGVYAELGVEPAAGCPLVALSSRQDLRRFVPGTQRSPAQVLVARSGDEPPVESARSVDGVEPVFDVESEVVCRVRQAACSSDPCVCSGLGFLPVEPFFFRFRDGEVRCHLAATDDGEVRECVATLQEADLDPTLHQLNADSLPGEGGLAVVDLDALTERQREVAAKAVECGYFDPDGPTAEAVAERLDISKSTLSAHLRAVRGKLGQQLFD